MKSSKNKPLISFFLLTFIFALPSYILVGLASKDNILSSEMAFVFVPLSALVPIGAALVLTYRENSWQSRLIEQKYAKSRRRSVQKTRALPGK